jgi:hypothetical protein
VLFNLSRQVSVKSCLAVNALFSFLVLVLCLTATVGIPLRHASGWILLTCSCLIFAAIANQKAFRLKFRLKIVLPVIVSAIALAIGVGAKSFQGCFPGITPGTWSYACFGQYLADYARGTDGALPYIDQFSAYFTDTRFGTSSLLGFLSAILHINTARAVFPALLIILANGLLGFCLLTRSLGANKIIALGSGVFFVLSGWTSDAITIGNLDNLLFLSLCAASLARLLLLVRGCRGWHALIALAINLAALFYSYPEGLIITTAIVAPFVIQLGFCLRRLGAPFQQRLLVAMITALALVVPYLQTWITFLSWQWSIENSLVRAGEGIFPGLLGPAFVPALLGLGEEFSKIPASPQSLLLAGGAGILCILGILGSRQWRVSKAASALIVIGLGVMQGVCLKYDYGLYKILFLSALIWLPSIFLGLDALIRNLQFHKRPLASLGGCLCLQSCFLFERVENEKGIPYQTKKEVKPYEQIQTLGRIVGKQPVLIDCSNDFEYEWALFFARSLSVQLLERKSFLKLFYENDLYGKRYLLPGLEKERVPAYILSDYPRARSVWNNDVFWLSSVPQELSILSIDSPNGIESKGGKKFLWIGVQPTKFFILADKERAAVLNSEAVVMGPSIPRSKLRNLCVRSANDIQEFGVDQHFSVSLQLRRGINEVEIWCKDRPEVIKGPNGDTRILLLGLLNYQLESTDAPSSSSKARAFISRDG